MSRKTIATILIIIVILAGVWTWTSYQRARKTQELLTQLADPDDAAAMDAMSQLRHRGSDLGPHLLPYLSSDNPRVRWRAAVLCAQIGARQLEVRRALTGLLMDRVPAVQRAAALACGVLGAADAEAALIRLLRDENETAGTRALAAQALGLLKSEKAIQYLADVLKQHPPVKPKKEAEQESTEEAATEAEAAAGEAGEEEGEEEAEPEDELWQARMEAAAALGLIGTAKCVDPLVDAAKDEVEPRVDVRVAAVTALADLATNPAAFSARTKAVEALLDAMGDEAGDVRIAAAIAFTRVYPPDHLQARVEKTLRDHLSDEHYWVREAVAQAMETLKISPTG